MAKKTLDFKAMEKVIDKGFLLIHRIQNEIDYFNENKKYIFGKTSKKNISYYFKILDDRYGPALQRRKAKPTSGPDMVTSVSTRRPSAVSFSSISMWR